MLLWIREYYLKQCKKKCKDYKDTEGEIVHRIKIDLYAGTIAKWLEHLLCQSENMSSHAQDPSTSVHMCKHSYTHYIFMHMRKKMNLLSFP